MLYSFAKILMTAGLRFFFRHLYFTGLEHIPAKGPVIIIANHNSSLMDAALLGILLPRPAYFFARGDVFANRIVKKILWWLHMMPVHSHQGGRQTLGINTDSFSVGRRVLAKGSIIVFFPESSSHTDHQLLPFRKGVFRLAFETAASADCGFDIPIIPIGITYDHPVAARQCAQVHIGKALPLSAYREEWHENAAAAILHVCRDAHHAIAELVLHVSDATRLETVNQYLVINRNNMPAAMPSWIISSNERLLQEQSVCQVVNNLQPAPFHLLQQRAGAYFQSMNALGLHDKSIVTKKSAAAWLPLLLLVCFPLYIAGLILAGPPVGLARWIADRKVTRKDFYSWIFVACYSVMFFVWTVLLLLFALWWKGWLALLLLAGAMLLLGILAYVYKDWQLQYRQYRLKRKAGAAVMTQLLSMRANAIIVR